MNLKKIPQKNPNLFVRKEDAGLLLYNKNSKRKFFIDKITEKIFEQCDGKKSFSDIISEISDIKKEELTDFFEDLIRAGLINIDGKLKETKGFRAYPYTISNITTPLVAPLHIYWEVTYNCNLNCKHCYVKDRKLSGDELDVDSCKKIIDQLARLKVFEITFSGANRL